MNYFTKENKCVTFLQDRFNINNSINAIIEYHHQFQQEMLKFLM